MKMNMGLSDKIIRIVSAVLVVILYVTNIINGTLAIVLLIVATIFIVTSFFGFCPVYLPFKISTLKRMSSKR
jgi:hypothetical protein